MSLSWPMRLSILFEELTDAFSRKHRLHPERFAKNSEVDEILSSQLDGEHLLLGIGDYGHIFRVRSTKERKELGNMLVVGRTRCGKGLLASSQILTWPESIIVNDMKGDLYHLTACFREKMSQIRVFGPPGYGDRFNPFLGMVTEDQLRKAATNLLFRPDEGENAIFTERAITMLTQLFLAARLEEQPLLPYIRHMIYQGPIDTAKRLNTISVQHNRYPNLATRFLDMRLSDMLQKHFRDDFFTSCWSTVTQRMNPLLTDAIVSSISESDFTSADIIKGNKPVTLYLRWPEDTLLSLAPLVRLVWCSLIDGMMRTYDIAEKEGMRKLCRPVLLLVDEAGRSAIPMLSEYVTTAVGRRIYTWMAIQSLSQLETVYGRARAEVIKDNMDTQIYYRPPNFNTAKFLRDSLGDESGFAESETLRDGAEASLGLSEQAVPLLSAQEVRRLEDYEVLIFFSNKRPIRAHRMDFRRFPLLTERLNDLDLMNRPPPPVPVLEPPARAVPDALQQGIGESEAEFVNPEHFVQ